MKENEYLEIEHNGKLLLPSESENKNRRDFLSKKTNEQILKRVKWILIIAVIIVLYFSYDRIVLFFFDMLKQSPTMYNQYLYLESEVQNSTITGIYFISILAALFFLVLPSELIFIHFLSADSYGAGTIIILTLLGCLTGLSINYFFGRFVGEGILKLIFKKKFEIYKKRIEDYGGYVLLFGNIFPGPIEVLAVFYGGFKFDYLKFLYLSLIGRCIKYGLLFIAFYFYWDQITFFYDSFLENLLILKNLYLY